MPRFPRASPTADGLSDRVYSALAARAAAHVPPVHPLHVGDTWRSPPPAARCEALGLVEHPRLFGYAPVQGEPALLAAVRARLRARLGLDLDPEALQITPGATTALAVVVATLLAPGDELLLPSPFWPLIRGMTAARGAAAVEVPFFTRLGAPGFDPEAALERAVGPRTAAIYVNDPHNPTGRVLPDEVADAVARVARRHDLWVIADAAYDELVYGPPRRPIWMREELADRAVVVHTLSKTWALAGARVGFVHGPSDVMAAVRGVHVNLAYCAPRPMQHLAVRALETGDAWLEETRGLYAAAGRAAALALGVPSPEAGTFLFVDVSPHLEADGLDGFLERCLEAGVLVTPGLACGRDFGTFVRLCFTAVPPPELDDALRRLGGVLGRAG
jgi:aspartate/methionine/tyrosine aminotransferase